MSRKRRIFLDDPTPPLHGAREGQGFTLHRGDRISVRHSSGDEQSGLVDELTGDGTVLWISLDHGLGRKLVHYADSVEIHRHD